MNYYIKHIGLLIGLQFWILTGLGQNRFLNLTDAYQCEDPNTVIDISFNMGEVENYNLLKDNSTYSIADFPNLRSFVMYGPKGFRAKQYVERWLLGIQELDNLSNLYVNSDMVIKDLGKVSSLPVRMINENEISILDSMETNAIKEINIGAGSHYLSDQLSVNLKGLDSLEKLVLSSAYVKEFAYSYDTNQNKLRKLLFLSDSLERVTAEGPPLDLLSIRLYSKVMRNLEYLDLPFRLLNYLDVDAPIETLGNSSILTAKGIVEVDFSNSRFTSIPTDVFGIASLRNFNADFASLDVNAIDLDGLDVKPKPDLDAFYVIVNPSNYSFDEIYSVKKGMKKNRRDSRKLAKKISFEDALVIKVKKIKKKK